VLSALGAFGLVVAAFFPLLVGKIEAPAEFAATLGVNLAVAVLYAVACYWFIAHAGGISDYSAARNSRSLATALGAQKSLWKLFGVTALVYIGLVVGFIVVMMFFGVWAAMQEV